MTETNKLIQGRFSAPNSTDQMLLILQCLLSSEGRLIPEQFAFRLKEWTEIGFPELRGKICCGVGFTVGSVIGHTDFVSDPHKAAFDIWRSNDFNLAANGAVMRTAVLGLSLFFDESHVVRNAINAAKVTHVDPRCIFSAVVVSVLISRMLRMELEIETENIMGDSDKEKLLQFVERATTHNDDSDSEPAAKKVFVAKPIPQPSSGFLQWFRKTEQPLSFPKHKASDSSRLGNPVKCSKDAKYTESLWVENDSLIKLVKDVVTEYKFLIGTKQEKAEWNVDMKKFCPPNNLSELELDDRRSMGYTYKCLGSALFCFSRDRDQAMDDADFFKQLITVLTLEAGDADTNAAVAGALLGCRFGFKGLPQSWVNGLRHKQFLMNICDELLDLVCHQLQTQLNKESKK